MGKVWDWFTDPFNWGDWQPTRWRFFLAILLFCLSFIAYYILKAIFLLVLKAVDKLLPKEYQFDNDIKKFCLNPTCRLGPVIIWFVCIGLMGFPESSAATKWLVKVVLFFMFWYIGKLGLGVISVARDVYLRHGKRTPRDIQFARMIFKIMKAVWVIVFGLFALRNLGVNVDNLIAYTIVFVAGLTYAAIDLIRNFYGGLRVFFAKPFERGHHIKLENRWYSVEGTIAKVGFSDTTVKTTEGQVAIVPNHVFVTNPVINLSKEVEQYTSYTEEEVDRYNPIIKSS